MVHLGIYGAYWKEPSALDFHSAAVLQITPSGTGRSGSLGAVHKVGGLCLVQMGLC